MASYNKVILMGRITADPELKQTPSGVSVTNFTLAVDRKYNKGEEKQADFITVIAWRHTADFITKYFQKGSAILIEGELQTRTWTDKEGNKRYATEVVASVAAFCEAKHSAETNSLPSAQNGAQAQSFAPQWEELDSDEPLPF